MVVWIFGLSTQFLKIEIFFSLENSGSSSRHSCWKASERSSVSCANCSKRSAESCMARIAKSVAVSSVMVGLGLRLNREVGLSTARLRDLADLGKPPSPRDRERVA